MDKISLKDVLEVFSVPLSEEQAWAVCFQCGKCLVQQWAGDAQLHCGIFKGIESVIMCKDGTIERNDALNTAEAAPTEYELVQSLGLVIYQALDYGLGETEEHKLSPALEGLIERMTESEETEEEQERRLEDTDGDEGIENDVDDEVKHQNNQVNHCRMKIEDVLQFCSAHLQSPSEAMVHYKAVCRAVVAEATELTSFLEQISSEKERLQLDMDNVDLSETACLEQLQRGDWARLWIQMMRELRQGVKLRKVDHTNVHHSVEFELTPYEILMEDIRTGRYTLNKVTVNNDIPPSARKDAHHIMLEFIRSRPPLHPVKDRVLATPPISPDNPREQLLHAIRSEPKLRYTPNNIAETSRTKLNDGDDTPATTRKVIKPNFNLCLSDEDDDDDLFESEDEDDIFDDKNKVTPSPLSPLSPLSPRKPLKSPQWQQTALQHSKGSHKGAMQTQDGTKHLLSITVCDSPTHQGAIVDPHSHPALKISPVLLYKQPKSVQLSLECLSLTIEEVMHIRNVLTKAEVESLLVFPELHDSVEKGKVCFTCRKTKFSLFSNWSTKCKFCQRYVCSKCVSKMRVPTEHFEHIPVYALSPSPETPDGEEDTFVVDTSGSVSASPAQNLFSPSHQSTTQRASTGSNQELSHSGSTLSATPSHHSDQSNSPETSHGPLNRLKELALQGAQMALGGNQANDSPAQTNSTNRPPLQRSHTIARPQTTLLGPTMSICRDCKDMVIGIIRASRSSLANTPNTSHDKVSSASPMTKPTRNFHLDLKPVYKTSRKK